MGKIAKGINKIHFTMLYGELMLYFYREFRSKILSVYGTCERAVLVLIYSVLKLSDDYLLHFYESTKLRGGRKNVEA